MNQGRFTVPVDVVARTVGDETVILHLASGTYFGLDPVGARIWQLVTEGRSLADVCNTMAAEFDVERPALDADVSELVQKLQTKGLLTAT